MSIDAKTVAKIAKLARIHVKEEEREPLAREISGILGWIEQLGEVNTEGVAQMTSVADVKLPWRKDEVSDGGKAEAVLVNAPAKEHGCFVVPKVIE